MKTESVSPHLLMAKAVSVFRNINEALRRELEEYKTLSADLLLSSLGISLPVGEIYSDTKL